MPRYYPVQRRTPVVTATLVINSAVFVLWFFWGRSNPDFMQENFLVSWTGLKQGYLWQLITSVYSHNMFLHFLINMFVLRSFGTLLEQILGSTRFLLFYLVAGIFSSFMHSFVSMAFLDSPGLPALGASGAVSGLVLLFSLMFPWQMLLFFGIIPIPAILGALAFVGIDLFGLFMQAKGGGLPIGHGAHLGGAFIGVLYFFFILRRHKNKTRTLFRSS